jgi:hypothetical protein
MGNSRISSNRRELCIEAVMRPVKNSRMNYDELLNRIYGAVAQPALWPETLTGLADHLDSIGGMLIYNAPPGGKNLIVLGRLDPERAAIFHKHYVWNPWTFAIKDQPFNKAIISGSLIERSVIKKTGFYADVLASQHIKDVAMISHRRMARDSGVGGFGFSLSAQGLDRAEQHRQRLQRLTPHLCRALDATLQLGPLADGSRQLARSATDAERRAAARQQAAYRPRQSVRRATAARGRWTGVLVERWTAAIGGSAR